MGRVEASVGLILVTKCVDLETFVQFYQFFRLRRRHDGKIGRFLALIVGWSDFILTLYDLVFLKDQFPISHDLLCIKLGLSEITRVFNLSNWCTTLEYIYMEWIVLAFVFSIILIIKVCIVGGFVFGLMMVWWLKIFLFWSLVFPHFSDGLEHFFPTLRFGWRGDHCFAVFFV